MWPLDTIHLSILDIWPLGLTLLAKFYLPKENYQKQLHYKSKKKKKTEQKAQACEFFKDGLRVRGHSNTNVLLANMVNKAADDLFIIR